MNEIATSQGPVDRVRQRGHRTGSAGGDDRRIILGRVRTMCRTDSEQISEQISKTETRSNESINPIDREEVINMLESSKRRSVRPVTGLAGALFSLSMVFMTSCGGGGDGDALTFPDRTVKEPDYSQARSIRGHVAWSGEVPTRRKLQIKDECHRLHEGDTLAETYIVENGRLANVFVYIKKGLEDYVFPHRKEPVKVDQKGCRYIPHVVWAQTHQPLEFLNSDGIQHNVHLNGKGGVKDRNRNFRSGSWTIQIGKPVKSLRTSCDVHSHMQAYINVIPHPYGAITDAAGSFRFDRVPPGTYTLGFVHETLGEKEMTVTVADGRDLEGVSVAFSK